MLAIFAGMLGATFLIWHFQEKQEIRRNQDRAVQGVQWARIKEDEDM